MSDDLQTALFRGVFDAATLGLIVVDQSGTIRSWNHWMALHADIPATAAVGKPLIEIFPELEGGRVDFALRFALRNELPSVLSQSLNQSPFPLFSAPDGQGQRTRINQSIHVLPITPPGQPASCLIQITDVSSAVSRERLLREQQQELQVAAVALNANDGIIISNKDGNIVRVNQAFQDITGYSEDEVIGKNPRLLSSGRQDKAFYAEMWGTIARTGTWRGELWDKHKNGNVFPKQLSITAVKNTHGETVQYVAIFNDISARKRIEQQLETYQFHLEDLVAQRTAELSQALETAQLADQAKDAFLANMSHELRTPLNAVIGMAGLARSLSTDPKQRDYLDKIAISGNQLSRIINDLLDLSKIAAGYMEMESISFSLHRLLTRCTSVMAHRASENGLTLVETVDANVPDVLRGDPLRIEQVLLNLLGNAIKFTWTGQIDLRVSLYASEEERVCLEIDVADTGIGMRPEDIERLFKPFSQADASISRQFGGTGLGLAISQRLVEMMGGAIRVDSHEGVGSTFSARIWLALGDAADLALASAADSEAVQVNYQDVRVLVVDDQPFNREVVEGLLAVVGITPCHAENGQVALDILATAPDAFDLVLMDVQMPVMDGLTAVRAIRRQAGFSTLPVIAMTAHTMAHEREKSVEAGMSDHIGKPFDQAGFYRTLAKWIPPGKQQLRGVALVRPAAVHGLPALCGVDIAAGLALMLGDEARYRHWLSDFSEQAPAALAEIRQSLSAATPEPAAMATHVLKGRTGMLGMSELHAGAALLEAAIDTLAPTEALLLALEQGVGEMCVEIRRALGLGSRVTPVSENVSATLPAGLPPASITLLIARLQAGDGNADLLAIDCLAELKDTAWASLLQQALPHIQNYDFASASKLLSRERQAPAE